jgi:hypothetical protein
MKRWHINRRDTHDDFVIVRWLGDGDVLMCRRPALCRFTVTDRRRLISTARSKRMAAAQELHGIGNA